jgi:50S ribosomal subunit-associated GTPase HflX
VEATLGELGLAERPRLTVLNKVDRLEEGRGKGEGAVALDGLVLPAWAHGGIAVSAARKWGLGELLRAIEGALAGAAEEQRFAGTR